MSRNDVVLNDNSITLPETADLEEAVKRDLISFVAVRLYLAQIPDYVTHEIINVSDNRSYTFYYRGTMHRYNSSGELISGPTNVSAQ